MGTPLSWNFIEIVQYFGPRVFFAILCGGLIGLERELKAKPAGIKTNMLICLGASLYTAVSILLVTSAGPGGQNVDPGRIAAQIVSGIGFLGGGTIIQSRGSIQGLTTAATIWVVAAIGLAIGVGYYDVALFSSVCVILLLVGATVFEDRVLGRSAPFSCEVVVSNSVGNIRGLVQDALAQNDLVIEDFTMTEKSRSKILTLHYSGHRSDHKKFLLSLWDIQGIKEIKPS